MEPWDSIWVVFKMRVPYYIGDLTRDPNLESYPCEGTICVQPWTWRLRVHGSSRV